MFSSNTSQVVATSTQAEAVDFDGTNDYLSRASNLTGNTDGKTLTFSGWIWANSATAQTFYAAGTGPELIIFCDVSGGALNFYVLTSDATLTTNLSVTSSAGLIPLRTWTHILLSVDLNNSANRSIYVNDVLISPTWTIYTNSTIDRTFTTYNVANNPSSSTRAKGRLSNVFLDYTYRDLSITANRRLFVTADLKPAAGQAALSPILYLPMSDPTTVGTNAGTGGNFTLTGTVARSGRGPNQYNAPYSDLDGTADYLSCTTALTGIADGKTFTLSFCFNKDSASNKYPFTIYSSTTKRFRAIVDSGGYITIEASSSAGTGVLFVSSSAGSIALNRNYVITVSVDLTDTAKRHFYINGSAATATWSTYSNTDIDFSPATPRYYAGYDANPANFFDGRLGAIWFNTSYIDLSVASNLAKFVSGTGIDAKPVDLGANGELPTGTSPLIYLPMYGNNAGKNYGTGGDFTVNSGPYTGARGPNEFWGNIADFGGITSGSYLNKDTSLGTSDGKTASLSFWIRPDSATTRYVFTINPSDGSTTHFGIEFSSNLRLQIFGGGLGVTTANSSIPLNAWQHVLVYFDLTDSSKRGVYINGVLATVTWNSYTNTNILFSSPNVVFAARNANYADTFDGKLSEFYFTTDYIDFSQEANRLKFRDAFGNPTDLPSAITAGTVPNPAIYMRFPPTSFGTNSGTGGNFTVNGTITDGGQL